MLTIGYADIAATRCPHVLANLFEEKITKTIVAVTIGSFLLLVAGFASAQVVVTFDENGNGTAGTAKMSFTTGPLRYQYPGGALTPGDVLLYEPGAGSLNLYSDMLIFDGNGITVYSDLEANEPSPDLADVPPSTFPPPGAGSLFLGETNASGGMPATDGGIAGLFGYSPTPGEPGGLPTGGVITYNFYSEVPEPASMSLLCIVAPALLIRRCRVV